MVGYVEGKNKGSRPHSCRDKSEDEEDVLSRLYLYY